MASPDARAPIDGDRPWPGLMSFDESAQAFFFGRDAEIGELMRLIRRETLTVLFGQSGLGKSSLLSAGVFPRLRQEAFFPIPVRLDVSLDALPLRRQVALAIRDSCVAHGVDAPPMPSEVSLWEYFHRDATDFWSASNQLLQPVLVFDQFEELFTLGQHDPVLRAACARFLEEIADLVEDRMPLALGQTLEGSDAPDHAIVFEKTHYRVVFSFREDYLAEFEGLKKQMRRIMHNRMRLLPMGAGTASAAVQHAGRQHVTEQVANGIVNFVGGGGAPGPADGPPDALCEELQVEPALLSLVCRELNEERIRRNDAVISTQLIRTGNADRIIENFYHDCFAGLDADIRRFVEDRLLTKSGFRDSCAVEEALEQIGVPPEPFDLLVRRRLLRYDVRHGVRRIELTHDVLTQVARHSRDARQANERAEEALRQAESARVENDRLKALHANASHFFGLALAEKAERAFNEDRRVDGALFAVHALANLDRARASAEYLTALGRRLSVMPARSTRLHDLFWSLRFVPDSTQLAVSTSRSIDRLDVSDLSRHAGMQAAQGETVQFELANDDRLLAARTRTGQMLLWSLPDYRQLVRDSAAVGAVTCLAFSVSGRYLAFGSEDGALRVLDLRLGKPVGAVRDRKGFPVSHPPCAIAWSPSETAFMSFSQRACHVWTGSGFSERHDLSLGTAVPLHVRQSRDHRQLALIARNRMVFCYAVREIDDHPPVLDKISFVSGNTHDFRDLALSPDGSMLATAHGNALRLFDWQSGRELTALDAGHDLVLSVDFSADGQWLAAGTRNADVWRWRLPSIRWEEQARADELAAQHRLDGVTVRRMTGAEIAAGAGGV